MFKGDLSDRLAIRELIDSYSDAVMRHDANDYIATWSENGKWALRGQVVIGRSNILEFWKTAMQDFQGVVFMSQPGSIEVEGNHACFTTHIFEHLVLRDGSVRLQAGYYRDEAVRTDTWRFSRRDFTATELKI